MARPRVEKRRGVWRIVAPLVIALIVLAAAALVVAWLPLRSARDAWRRGNDSIAIANAGRWSSLHLWPSQYDQMLAAAYLTAGNSAAAKPHLAALSKKTLWVSVVNEDEVAQRLFAAGRYADFLAYDASVHDREGAPNAPLYRVAAQLATGHVKEADEAFPFLLRSGADPKKIAMLQQAIAQRKSGAYPLVFARDNSVIATVRTDSGELIASDRDFDGLVDRDAGAFTIGAHLPQLGTQDTIDTTLDPEVQRAAIAALGSYRAALVAIDPRTNEILAIANTRGKGALQNLAFEGQYEPGSVIKVLTGLNALSGGVDVKSMFPYNCKGDLMIDGRHFGDWIAAGHGELPDIDEALAESCNIAFADIGLRLGVDRLKQFMSAAGFDGQTDLGVFQVPLGRTVGQIFNHYETAFYAIGLEHETTNAMHLAMLASMMANRGTLTTPRLLRGRRSILGDEMRSAQKQGRAQLAPAAVAEQMVQAMRRVVTSPKGTGRRAAVEGIDIAMKTGTAGERKEGGLESVIMAFAPADSPRIAFGMIAEDAGPAEYAGAKIVHDFVEALRPRLK